MSEHTKKPWLIVPGKAFIYALDENGVNRFQASIGGAHCPESELVANARHIVHCVNNHERLVEALQDAVETIEDQHDTIWGMAGYGKKPPCKDSNKAQALLAVLKAKKGGKL